MIYKIIKHVLEEEGYRTKFPFSSIKDVEIAHLHIYRNDRWICAIRFYKTSYKPYIQESESCIPICGYKILLVRKFRDDRYGINLWDPDGLYKMLQLVRKFDADVPTNL